MIMLHRSHQDPFYSSGFSSTIIPVSNPLEAMAQSELLMHLLGLALALGLDLLSLLLGGIRTET
jgi:hypothetical protein